MATQSKARSGAPVLCAVDESATAQVALRVASDVANALGRTLHLVLVRTRGEAEVSEAHSRRTLARSAASVGATVTHLESSDEITDGIAAAAARIDPALVVVGARHRGVLARLFLGSVAVDLLYQAQWPLLIVHERTAWPPARIVVGEDGGSSADHASNLAAVLAKAYSAEMTIVESASEAFEIPPSKDPRGEVATSILNRARDDLRRRADALLLVTGTRPRTIMRSIDPTMALDEEASGTMPALLVVGHRSAMERADSDVPSVAMSLAKVSKVPLLIYPSSAAEQEYWTQQKGVTQLAESVRRHR